MPAGRREEDSWVCKDTQPPTPSASQAIKKKKKKKKKHPKILKREKRLLLSRTACSFCWWLCGTERQWDQRTHGFPALAPMGGSARAAQGPVPMSLPPPRSLVPVSLQRLLPGWRRGNQDPSHSPWDRCCFGAGKTPLAPGCSAWGTFTCTRIAPAQGKSSTHPVGQEANATGPVPWRSCGISAPLAAAFGISLPPFQPPLDQAGAEFPCCFWGHCLGGCKTWWLHGWTRWETQICGCADVPLPARPH